MAGEAEWPDGVIAEPFLDDEVIGIAPPARLPARVSAEELAGQTLLVLGARLQRGDQAHGARRARDRFRLPPRGAASDISLICSWSMAGDAVA
jgi:DNA-binding transcriptional LysR family regulator